MKRTQPKTKKHTKSGQTASLRCDALAPGSVSYALFEHMEAEHGLTLLGSELTEIIRIVNSTLEARLEWWMRNAEGIALERYDLLKTLREIRDPRTSMEWQAKIIDAAIERNSPNVADEPRGKKTLEHG